MVIQYSDNVLVHLFKILAVFSIYGVFSATIFFFLAAFLIFLFVHRRLSSLRIYGDEENLPKRAGDTPLYDGRSFASNSIVHNQYFSTLRALFYFYSFLWVLTYFGVEKALYFYAALGLLFYLYLYAYRDFRGYERSYLNKISLLDPRPGFFPPRSFSGGVDDAFVFEFLEDTGFKPFLDTRFQILKSPRSAGNHGNVNAFNVSLTKDPHFLSKLLYYYADIYIYNSIHNFWLVVSEVGPAIVHKRVFKNSENCVAHTHMRFYPTEHFGLADMFRQSTSTASYIKSQTFVFNTIKDVYMNTASQAFSDSLYLRYLGDPFFRLGVPVSSNKSCFPSYKKDSSSFIVFRSLFEGFLLAPARLEFLLKGAREELGDNRDLLRRAASNFNFKVKSTVFNLFPRVYYFKWLSYFLSFFLTETSLNLRFKNILIPEHWYNLASMYRYKRKPSRSRAGLHFSRLGTGQMLYNTDYTYKRGILEFIFNSYLYPVNNRSKNYYYLNGFTRFNILGSFDFVSLLVEPFFMFPVRAYINRVRARMKNSQELDFREPLKVFEVRRLIRKTGDGMEPFLSTGYFMGISNINFVNDLGYASYNDGFVRDIQDGLNRESLPIFSSLANNSSMAALRNLDFKSSRLVNVVLFMDPSWLMLKDMVKSNPSLKLYLKNLYYNQGSSEFYEWFKGKHCAKPFFQLYELSLGLHLKSPDYLKILDGAQEAANAEVFSNTTAFSNYQILINQPALKITPFVKIFENGVGTFAFRLNRIKRSNMKKFYLPRPLYKKSYIQFKQLPSINLNLLSPFSIFKFSNTELLERRVERSKLRLLLRDPFLFLNKGGRVGKNRIFRRFLWSNIFLKPAFAAFLKVPRLTTDFSKELSAFLLKTLSPWLQDRYRFSPTYVNYIFLDLTIFREYSHASYKEERSRNPEFRYQEPEALGLWNDLSKNQFDVLLWKSYLSLLFSDNRFYSYTISRGYGITHALSNLLLDKGLAMNFLLEIKNNYILQFPTKYMNFLAIRSSEGSMSFGRGTWKLFIATLNALTYLLIKSVLDAGTPNLSSKSFDNFFILLEQLKQDSKAYNHIAKHLFLTLDPMYDFKRVPNIAPYDNGLLLSFLHRAEGVDWWEGIPDKTIFKAVEHVLQMAYYEGSGIDKEKFSLYMAEFWDDFSKREFVTSLKSLSRAGLPRDLLLKIFNKGVTRASAAIAVLDGPLEDRKSTRLNS